MTLFLRRMKQVVFCGREPGMPVILVWWYRGESACATVGRDGSGGVIRPGVGRGGFGVYMLLLIVPL